MAVETDEIRMTCLRLTTAWQANDESITPPLLGYGEAGEVRMTKDYAAIFSWRGLRDE